MAIYNKGADPVALRASAERLTAYAHKCDGAQDEASKAMVLSALLPPVQG